MLVALTALTALAGTPASEDPVLGETPLRFNADIGFLAPLSHTIQFSRDGTKFDYVKDGGQEVLFPFVRFSADLDIKRHSVVLLYQPLDLVSQVWLQDEVRVDGAVFPAESTLDLRYGFSFFRGSWLYDLQKDPDREIALGLSLQIRNATILFSSGDGLLRRENRDIGPVPILKFRSRQPLAGDVWWGFEADGFYAPIKYLNGGSTDVVGAILDASLKAGLPIRSGDAYLSLRYIGGGAEGTDQSPDGPGDGFVANWLHFGVLSLGFALR